MINSPLNELLQFLKEFISGKYPDYILKNRITTEVPVFTYHSITSWQFENHLLFLMKNEYQTLNADELRVGIDNPTTGDKNSIAITFDDGLREIYDTVFPLLKKYSFKIIAFILPHWVGKPGMLTWPQIKEMHESGYVDFQSHSMSHPAIFISPKLIDFYHPMLTHKKAWSIPVVSGENHPPEWGTPLFESGSRFCDKKRFLPNEKLVISCINHVRENGGENFFTKKGWRRELVSITKSENTIQGRFEMEREQTSQIFKELHDSKLIIEAQLSKTVSHFAFPWNQLGILASGLLAKAGYTTAFIGLSGDNVSLPIRTVRRVSGIFLKCLPGTGRQSFFKTLLRQLTLRIKHGTPY